MMLEIRDVRKSFGGQTVLDGISLDVEKGDVVAILGPSGSGKTTFLRCLNFLEKADGGRMIFDGEQIELNGIKKKDIARLRRKTGFVFQNYNLFQNKTVLQNVTLGLTSGIGMDKKQAEAKAMEMLEKVGMADKLKSYPSQLSGGQQQRVAIARAVMRRLAEDGMTMLVVTHEMDFARNVSNKVMFMENGKVVETAPSKQFFEQPSEPRAREFIKKIQNS